jgi:hypothetical protein
MECGPVIVLWILEVVEGMPSNIGTTMMCTGIYLIVEALILSLKLSMMFKGSDDDFW